MPITLFSSNEQVNTDKSIICKVGSRRIVSGMHWQGDSSDRLKVGEEFKSAFVATIPKHEDDTKIPIGYASIQKLAKSAFSLSSIVFQMVKAGEVSNQWESIKGRVILITKIVCEQSIQLYSLIEIDANNIFIDDIGTADEIQELLTNLYSSRDYDFIICPTLFKAPNPIQTLKIQSKDGDATEISFWVEQVSKAILKDAKLRPLKRSLLKPVVIIAIAYLMIEYVVIPSFDWTKKTYFAPPPPPPAPPAEPVKTIYPWEYQALPISLWKGCKESINRVDLWVPGWNVSELSCELIPKASSQKNQIGFLSMKWQKNNGRLAVILAKMSKLGLSVTPNGNQASLIMPFNQKNAFTREVPDELTNLVDASITLNLVSESNLINLSQTVLKPTENQNLPGQQPQASDPNFQLIKWTISTSIHTVEEIISLLDSKGLRITKISAQPELGSWSIEGVLYAK